MKNFYIPLLCILFLSSCSRLITKGVTDKNSNYVVTGTGQQVNASSVSIQGDVVTADTAKYSVNNLSAIKIGPGYYGVQDGLLYDGVYFGKLILLRRYSGSVYDMSTHTSHASYSYYLQKQGQPDIFDFTGRNLVESVNDDPLALRKARASNIYTTVSFISAGTAIAGLSCVFLSYSSPIRKPAVKIGLYSLPVFLITLPTASHKRYKTIVVYDKDNP